MKNKFKTETFWFVSKSFCYTICTKFPKKWWWGENRKEPSHLVQIHTNVSTKTRDSYQRNPKFDEQLDISTLNVLLAISPMVARGTQRVKLVSKGANLWIGLKSLHGCPLTKSFVEISSSFYHLVIFRVFLSRQFSC